MCIEIMDVWNGYYLFLRSGLMKVDSVPRCLAMISAPLKFDEHEAWAQQLLGQLTREPPGFTKVSISQAIRADRDIFTIMAQELQDSVQPDSRRIFPMEAS